MTMGMIDVYIPCRDEEEARRISLHLLEKRLIACSNIWPVNSLYIWKGQPADEKEFVILAKTADEKYPEIIVETEKLHSYEVPGITKFNIEANEAYGKWLRKEVSQ